MLDLSVVQEDICSKRSFTDGEEDETADIQQIPLIGVKSVELTL